MCYLYSCTFVNDLEVPIIDHEAHFGIEVEIDSSLLRRGSERGIELSDYNPSCDGWMGDEGGGDGLFSVLWTQEIEPRLRNRRSHAARGFPLADPGSDRSTFSM